MASGRDYNPKHVAFARLWRLSGGAAPLEEHRFHPVRKWRFDYCWPFSGGGGVAVEIDGGVFTRGRHVRGRHYMKDCEKMNAAVELGWKVLRYTTTDLEERPADVIEQVKRVLSASKKHGEFH